MKSAIISVGTELLFGKVVNTNAAYLSRELNEMGIGVMYHYTMGDNPGRLRRILEFALEDCDLLVITGGLGPTEDDLTKEIVCEFMEKELVLDQNLVRRLKAYFERTGYIYTENNLKQAWIPVDGTVFENTQGTAPGFAVEKDGKTILCMPGVPREMKAMFELSARLYLMKKADACIFSRSVKVFGVGESLTETMLLPYIDGQTDPTIATYAKEGVVEIRITSRRPSEEEAAAAVEEMLAGVLETMGDSVFTTDGRELQEELVSELCARGLTLACCEGPTAGMFASWLAEQPETEGLFRGGFVLNRPEEAEKFLDIPAGILKDTPICGGPAAEALAEALYRKTGADLCIAVTGAAGPEAPEGYLPGMYHISILLAGTMHSRAYYRKGRSRGLNREFMAQTACDMILRILRGRSLQDVR